MTKHNHKATEVWNTSVWNNMCWIDYLSKEWCILFADRPPQNNNLKTFSEEINLSLSTIVNEYDNIMLIGDLSQNTKSKNNSYYSDLCDTFDLTNLIKANTCFKSSNQTSIGVILTNRPRNLKVRSNYHRAQWLSQNDLDFLPLLLFQITT